MGKRSGALEKLVVSPNKLLIFDLDGTLVKSETQIGMALNRARVEFGFRELEKGKVAELLGLPIVNFLHDLGVSPEIMSLIISRFREILKGLILEGNEIYEGVREFVNFVPTLGFKLAIATSKPTYLAEMVIQNSELSGMFDVIQGTDQFPAKPDPTCLILAMRRANSDRAIMVGDRIEDIEAANAVGIKSIGVAQSFHSVEALKLAGAELAFNDFTSMVRSPEVRRLLIS